MKTMRNAAILLLSAMAADIAAAQAPTTEQIIVKGERDRGQIEQFVSQLKPAQGDTQLGKFLQPICPSVTGLADRQNRRVADRMREVAQAAGIDVARPGCDANIAVLVVTNKAATMKALMARNSHLFYGLPLSTVHAMERSSSPAVAWQVVDEIGTDGMPLEPVRLTSDGDNRAAAPDEARVVRSFGAVSRLRELTVPQFLDSIVIIEASAAQKFTATQLADYALMRALVGTGDAFSPPPQSILGMLSAASSGGEAPLSVTWGDIALLKSLYATSNAVSAIVQRDAIATRMESELAARQR
ncbi:MAG TPA: hypothetical protein VH392_09875 [Sphingomicrobium sp.]